MNSILQTLKGLGAARLAIIGGVSAAALIFFIFLIGHMTQPQMTLLFGDLDLRDSAQIAGKLDALKVSYQLAGNGTEILVPEDQVLKLRLTMSQDGLPSGGSLGYEIFDRDNTFGTTSFVQNIDELRALEGELARTIRAIDGVDNARVNLVLPKRELFSRDKQEATASILLRMRGGYRLDKEQVIAIQNLVAAAVPDLKPNHISIVDQSGTLLAAAGEGDGTDITGQSDTRAAIKAGVENHYAQAIEALLAKSVGPGRVRAEVSVDMDFDHVTTNQETYDPDGQVVRSTQTTGDKSSSSDQNGNSTVSVGNNLPQAKGQPASGTKAGTNLNTTQHDEETTNYEISKTVRTQISDGGTIKRVSVAVLVDGVHGSDASGKPTYRPRSPDELKQLTALARSAIGYDAKRGDTVDVINMPFVSGPELPPAPADHTLFGLGKVDLFRIAELLVLGVVALLVLLLVVRPLLQRALAPRPLQPELPGGGLPQLGAGMPAAALAAPDGSPEGRASGGLMGNNVEAMLDIARVEGQVKQSSLRRIGEIIEKHPDEAVAIMRSWLYQDT